MSFLGRWRGGRSRGGKSCPRGCARGWRRIPPRPPAPPRTRRGAPHRVRGCRGARHSSGRPRAPRGRLSPGPRGRHALVGQILAGELVVQPSRPCAGRTTAGSCSAGIATPTWCGGSRSMPSSSTSACSGPTSPRRRRPRKPELEGRTLVRATGASKSRACELVARVACFKRRRSRAGAISRFLAETDAVDKEPAEVRRQDVDPSSEMCLGGPGRSQTHAIERRG